jgi:hypothetical protein
VKVTRATSILLTAFFGSAFGLLAQQPTPPPAAPAPKMEMPGAGMMDEEKMDEAMMARHHEMMARMEAMDAKLDDLVKKMDAARGSKKADAVAAVVSELVRQRKEMREHMAAMQPEMMHHMMEHMRMGMTKGLMECPMMKQMEGAPPSGKPEEHSGHH